MIVNSTHQNCLKNLLIIPKTTFETKQKNLKNVINKERHKRMQLKSARNLSPANQFDPSVQKFSFGLFTTHTSCILT